VIKVCHIIVIINKVLRVLDSTSRWFTRWCEYADYIGTKPSKVIIIKNSLIKMFSLKPVWLYW